MRGCARFPEFLQNFSERQIFMQFLFGSLFFLAVALKLPIQTLLSVAPKLSVCLRSGEKCENFRKTSTPRGLFHPGVCSFSQNLDIFHVNSKKLGVQGPQKVKFE